MLRITRLISKFCTAPTSGKPATKYTMPSYTYEVIGHFDQICKLKGKNGYVSVLPCYPQYQVSKTGAVSIKARYNKNYIYLWRFQMLNENSGDGTIRESLNFPVSFENFGSISYLSDQYQNNPQVKLEEQTIKGTLTFSINVNYTNKIVNLALHQVSKEVDALHQIDIGVPQFKLMIEQMKQGLPIVTGWAIPNQLLQQIAQKQE